MITKTFNRIEKKYRISSDQYENIKAALNTNMFPDDYKTYTNISIYFDTENGDIISRSIDKPLYKEKLRLRSYGFPKDNDAVFLELKKKYKGIVYKRRIVLSKNAAEAFINGADYFDAVTISPLNDKNEQDLCFSKSSIQIAKEIRAYLQRYNNLGIGLITKYNRESYANKNNDGFNNSLRITIDSNIEFCKALSNVLYSDDWKFNQLLSKDEYIMEIKCVGGMPLWLAQILNNNKIYPQSFSKCGEAFKKIWNNKYSSSENIQEVLAC